MHHLNLDALVLEEGSHRYRSNGLCLMEAVAWWANEEHTSHPHCVSLVLGAYGRTLNDYLPQAKRQKLRQFIPLLPGTRHDGKDKARSFIALDWLVRTWMPAWLDVAKLTSEAVALRLLEQITDAATAAAALPMLEHAHMRAVAAGPPSFSEAWDVAGDVAVIGEAALNAAQIKLEARYAALRATAVSDAAVNAAAASAGADATIEAISKRLAPAAGILEDSAITLFEIMFHG